MFSFIILYNLTKIVIFYFTHPIFIKKIALSPHENYHTRPTNRLAGVNRPRRHTKQDFYLQKRHKIYTFVPISPRGQNVLNLVR